MLPAWPPIGAIAGFGLGLVEGFQEELLYQRKEEK